MRYTIIAFFILLIGANHNFIFAQKKKSKNSKNIHIDALIDYQSAQPKLRIAFEITRLLGNPSPEAIEIKLKMRPLGTSNTVFDSTITLNQSLQKYNRAFIYQTLLPSIKQRMDLKITVNDLVRNESKSLDMYVIPPISYADFAWENLTSHLQQTVKSTDSVKFTSDKHKKLWVYRFHPNFLPAAPPMQSKVVSGRKSMEVDSLFSISVDQPIQFKKEALYFIQADTTGHIGLGFRITPNDYPTFTHVNHVANALIYLTTLKDISAMLATDNQKATLDEFWLKLGGSEVNARRLIKAYYQRVSFANQHFSSHKLGWKTDKGMIYIVFGKPDEIIKGEDYETWQYNNQKPGNQRVSFEFIHKPGLFSHNHYQLRRGNEFKAVWYNKVRDWRKGSILTFD